MNRHLIKLGVGISIILLVTWTFSPAVLATPTSSQPLIDEPNPATVPTPNVGTGPGNSSPASVGDRSGLPSPSFLDSDGIPSIAGSQNGKTETSILFTQDFELNKLGTNGSNASNPIGSDVSVIGTAESDFDNDDSYEVPYIKNQNEILLAEANETGSVNISQHPAKTDKSLLTATDFESESYVFYVAATGNGDEIYRTSPSWSPERFAAPENGVDAVSGAADIDGDETKELVFVDGSQAVRYVDPGGRELNSDELEVEGDEHDIDLDLSEDDGGWESQGQAETNDEGFEMEEEFSTKDELRSILDEFVANSPVNTTSEVVEDWKRTIGLERRIEKTYDKAYGSVGSNNNVGIGAPADFDGDGNASIPVVDGSNQILLVGPDGVREKVITGSDSEQAVKSPLAPSDIDSDGELEIVYIENNNSPPEIKYADNVTGDSSFGYVRDGNGSRIEADTARGIASAGVDNSDEETSNQKPDADFVYHPNRFDAPETVYLDAYSSEDPDGSVSSYEWDIGADGTYEKTGEEIRTEISSNETTVRLRVTDDGGRTATETKNLGSGLRGNPEPAKRTSEAGIEYRFQAALRTSGSEKVEINDDAYIDSYDSSEGTYLETFSTKPKAPVLTDGETKVEDDAQVYGDVVVDAPLEISDSPTVAGYVARNESYESEIETDSEIEPTLPGASVSRLNTIDDEIADEIPDEPDEVEFSSDGVGYEKYEEGNDNSRTPFIKDGELKEEVEVNGTTKELETLSLDSGAYYADSVELGNETLKINATEADGNVTLAFGGMTLEEGSELRVEAAGNVSLLTEKVETKDDSEFIVNNNGSTYLKTKEIKSEAGSTVEIDTGRLDILSEKIEMKDSSTLSVLSETTDVDVKDVKSEADSEVGFSISSFDLRSEKIEVKDSSSLSVLSNGTVDITTGELKSEGISELSAGGADVSILASSKVEVKDSSDLSAAAENRSSITTKELKAEEGSEVSLSGDNTNIRASDKVEVKSGSELSIDNQDRGVLGSDEVKFEDDALASLTGTGMDFYVREKFEFKNAQISVPGFDSRKLTLFCSSECETKIEDGSEFVGGVYAPTVNSEGKFELKDESDVYGAVVAGEAKVENSSTIHFDRALQSEGIEADFTYTPDTPAEFDDITLNASPSNVAPNATYSWGLDEGGSPDKNVNSTTITHHFAQNRSYDINLTVRLPDGNTDTVTKSIDVIDRDNRPVNIKRLPDRPHSGNMTYPLIAEINIPESQLNTSVAEININDNRTIETKIHRNIPKNITSTQYVSSEAIVGEDINLTRARNPITINVGNYSDTLLLDGDRLTDFYEKRFDMNPLDPNSNSSLTEENESKNNVTDGLERLNSTNLPLYVKSRIGSHPLERNTDNDSLSDEFEFRELGLRTSVQLSDSDNDSISDEKEDPDEDGLTNIQERNYGTSPLLKDTDNDMISDKYEVEHDKLDPSYNDTDSDGLKDLAELWTGNNPSKTDTDSDGIDDKNEEYIARKANKDADASVGLITKASNIHSSLSQITIEEKADDVYFNNISSAASSFVEASSTTTTENLSVSIGYDSSGIENESDLSIYKWSYSSNEFIEMDSEVNRSAETVETTADEASTFVVMESTSWESEKEDISRQDYISDPDDDPDNDGLTNAEELERKPSPDFQCPSRTDPDSDNDDDPDGNDTEICSTDSKPAALQPSPETVIETNNTQIQLKEISGNTDDMVRIIELGSHKIGVTSSLDEAVPDPVSFRETVEVVDDYVTDASKACAAKGAILGEAGETTPLGESDATIPCEGTPSYEAGAFVSGVLGVGDLRDAGANFGQAGNSALETGLALAFGEETEGASYNPGEVIVNTLEGSASLAALIPGVGEAFKAGEEGDDYVKGSGSVVDYIKSGSPCNPASSSPVSTLDCLGSARDSFELLRSLPLRSKFEQTQGFVVSSLRDIDLSTVNIKVLRKEGLSTIEIDLRNLTYDVNGPDIFEDEIVTDGLEDGSLDRGDVISVGTDASFSTPTTYVATAGSGGGFSSGTYLGGGGIGGGGGGGGGGDGGVASVNAGPDFTIRVNQTVTLAVSAQAPAAIEEYRWSFGDGTQVVNSGGTVEHAYDSPGTYTIRVVVVDTEGNMASDTVTVTVLPRRDRINTIGGQTAIVQKKINNASSGDAIELEGGTYNGIDLSTDGLIVGGENNTTIRTAKVTGENISLQNVKIEGGIRVEETGFSLYDSTVTHSDGWGVAIKADNTTVQKTEVTAEDGIYTSRDVSYVTIAENDISASNQYGVRIGAHGEDVFVTDNTISSGEYGIQVGHSADETLMDNKIDSPTLKRIIPNEPPILKANPSDGEVVVGESVGIEAKDTTDPNADTFTYGWDVDGDGAAEIKNEPVETSFDDTGTQTVTLIATDQHGAKNTTEVPIQVVNNTAPDAEFRINSRAENDISFDASPSSDPDGHRLTYVWEFGDATTAKTSNIGVVHTYSSEDTYTVNLTVLDGFGGSDTFNRTINTSNLAPVADAGPDRSAVIGSTVVFNGSRSYDPDPQDDLSYKWTFEDGEVEAQRTASRKLTGTGRFNATLSVIDDIGQTHSDTVTVTVVPRNVSFNTEINGPNATRLGSGVEYSASVFGVFESNVSQYEWQTGDGTTLTGKEISHSYTQKGTYDIELQATLENGSTATDSKEVLVAGNITRVSDNLQEVIDNSEPGDTLLVQNGTYQGVEFRTDDISVIGEGDVDIGSSDITQETEITNVNFQGRVNMKASGSAIYNSSVGDSDNWGIVTRGNDMTIKSTEFRTPRGIYVDDRNSNIRLLNNTLNVDRGIRFNYRSSSIVADSIINASDTAFEIEGRTDIEFDGVNTVKSGSNVIKAASQATASGDTVVLNRSSIRNVGKFEINIPNQYYGSQGSVDIRGSGYRVESNAGVDLPRINLKGSGVTLAGAKITQSPNWGIVTRGNNFNIINTTIRGPRGIYIDDRNSNILLENNTLEVDRGIRFNYRSSTTLSNNTIDSSDTAFEVESRTDIDFNGTNTIESGSNAIEAVTQGAKSDETLWFNGSYISNGKGFDLNIPNNYYRNQDSIDVRGNSYRIEVGSEPLLPRTNLKGSGVTLSGANISDENDWGVVTRGNGFSILETNITGNRGIFVDDRNDNIQLIGNNIDVDSTGVKFNYRSSTSLSNNTISSSGNAFVVESRTDINFESTNDVTSGNNVIEAVTQASSAGDTLVLDETNVQNEGTFRVNIPQGYYRNQDEIDIRGSGYAIEGREGVLLPRLNLRGSDVTLSELSISDGGDWGIVTRGNGFTVENTSISGNRGIFVDDRDSNIHLVNNSIDVDSTGVRFNYRSSTSLSNNTISSLSNAFVVEDRTDIEFNETNEVESGSNVIEAATQATQAGDTLLLNNSSIQNVGDYEINIPEDYYQEQDNVDVRGGSYTIQVGPEPLLPRVNLNGANVTLSDVNIYDQDDWGIVTSGNEFAIEDSEVTAQKGILVDDRDKNIRVLGTEVGADGTGIQFQYRSSGTVSNSTIASKNSVAVTTESRTSGEVVDNTILETLDIDGDWTVDRNKLGMAEPTGISNKTRVDTNEDIKFSVEINNTTDIREFKWDFGDGLTTTGKSVVHDFDRSGTYDVEVTAVNEFGIEKSDTIGILVNTSSATYTEKFEDGIQGWDVVQQFANTTQYEYEGSYSGGASFTVSGDTVAKDIAFPGGDRPNSFEFYYRESSGSNGGGINLTNSDGNVEVGFGTNNPQWELFDDRGRTRVYSGDGYNHWNKVRMTFDWQNDTYYYRIQNLRSGAARSGEARLRIGKDIRLINVVNIGGDDFRMWFDNIRLSKTSSAVISNPDEISVREGEEAFLDGRMSAVGNGSLQWSFGDGDTAEGRVSRHRFDEPGTYEVQLSVTDEGGNVIDTESITVDVEDTSTYVEGFEDGLESWKISIPEFEAKSNSVYKGDRSAGVQSTGIKTGEVASDTVFPDGGKPSSLSFYWRESSSSNGGALRIKNSNGNYEAGFGSGNPAWYILGENGSTRYQNDGYGQWVKISYSFDWEDSRYYYKVEDLGDGNTVSGNKSLRHGVDIEKVTISNGRSLWNDGDRLYMWFDNISVSTESDAQISTPDGLDVRVGENVSFDGGQSAAVNKTMRWDFGDGDIGFGRNPEHKYSSSGEYNVQLSVVGENNQTVDSDNITVNVNEVDEYSEGFEDGMVGWTDSIREPAQGEVTRKSNAVYSGSYSAGLQRSEGIKTGELASDVVYPKGGEPSRLVFYWRESSSSNGGALRIKNSNGDYEAGLGSGNPAWHILGENGSTRYQNDGYGQWIRVEYRFDWEDDTYYYTVTDQSSGVSVSGSKSLRHGVDMREITISNGRSLWNDGDSFHTWFDEITVDEDSEAVISSQDIAGTNRSVTFDARDSYGKNPSFTWSFGDEKSASGPVVSHSYTSPGRYNVSLTVETGTGIVEATKQIEIRDGYYAESFRSEEDLDNWSYTSSSFQRTTKFSEHSAGAFGGSSTPRVLANDTVYSDGRKPDVITYRYRETFSSNGGGVRFVNSQGEYEFGIATDNPQYDISDANGVTNVGSGSYDRWTEVVVEPDWQNNTFSYNINNGEATGTGDMKQGLDIEKISLEKFGGTSWRSDTDIHMRFNDIVIKQFR